jgi:beta-N-acetylhexosaminidase
MAVRTQLAQGTIGGVVLYPDNIRSVQQLRLLTAFLANAKSELVPLIAVDQEGGVVQRLTRRKGYVYFPSARDVARDPRLRTPDGARRLYGAMAQELALAGINLNFGPVVDLSLNPGNNVIVRRKRSFGSDPETVTVLAGAFITAHREANVLTAAKHFPGHGSSWSDSHKALPDVSLSWRESELEPYRRLARDGLLDMVMVGHLYHPRFSDGEKLPASLSARAIDALRADGYIGFKGVVVSDDLEMGAVRESYSLADRVIKAVNAGTDLLVFSNVISRDPRHHRRGGARRAHPPRAHRKGLWTDHLPEAPLDAARPRRNLEMTEATGCHPLNQPLRQVSTRCPARKCLGRRRSAIHSRLGS